MKQVFIDRENDDEFAAILRKDFPFCVVTQWFKPERLFSLYRDAAIVPTSGKKEIMVRIHLDGFIETLCNHSAV